MSGIPSIINSPDEFFPSECKVLHYIFGTPDGLILCKNDDIFITTDNDGRFLSAKRVFITVRDGEVYAIISCPEKISFGEDIKFQPLKKILPNLNEEMISIAMRGIHLLRFYDINRFCGKCGNPTEISPIEHAVICKNCHSLIFPKISPAIIVRVTKGDEILLARSPGFTPGMYSVIAGFVETGETLEDAVRREVIEEVGISVRDISYFSSQPWPFPDSLMIGFTASYKSGEIRPDNYEIEKAGWFRSNNLPGLPEKYSISRKLIDDFIKQGY